MPRYAGNSIASGGTFDPGKINERLERLSREASDPDFWKNPESAKKTLGEKSRLEKELKRFEELDRRMKNASELLDLAGAEEDLPLMEELSRELSLLSEQVSRLAVEKILSGPKDANNAIVTIHPGAGGTESQDWAQMLMRMYLRWAERKGFKTDILDLQPGEEAGIKSVTFSVSGEFAYGYLKSESGVHRLVRISPFDANKRRHTSFASAFVSPEVGEEPEVMLDDKDLKTDTYRASSAGGQHVNKTSSAVRITHLPTGTVVQCQNERSQHQNRAVALKVLRSRLYEMAMKKKKEEIARLAGEKKEIGWGSQIRSYVFQPYQMVKDHRSGLEKGNVEAVMNGEIDDFIDAYLLASAG